MGSAALGLEASRSTQTLAFRMRNARFAPPDTELPLAATFAALGTIPILFLVQIAFIVAFGVLLDTFLVRSLLVPALAIHVGRPFWWPSRLGRRPATAPDAEDEPTMEADPADAHDQRDEVPLDDEDWR